MIGCPHCVRPRSDDVRQRVGGTESAVFHLICFLISGVADKPASTLASSSAMKVIYHSLLVFCILIVFISHQCAAFLAVYHAGVVGGKRDALPNIANMGLHDVDK